MRRIPAEPMSPLAPLSRWLGLAALILAALGLVGARFGGVPPLNGIAAYSFALFLACLAVAAATGAFAAIWRFGGPGLGTALKGLLLALAVAGPAAWFGAQALRLPAINDISTDLADPLSFSRTRAAVDGRQGLIPPEFNPANAEEQQAGYPDLQALVMDQSPEEVLQLALRAATNQGWQVLDSTPPTARGGAGRIEATARTLVFGFTDDITIRIRAGINETRVDLRSRSRVGKHDFGQNAQRIRAFQKELEALSLQR
jgi:Protein of unknown function (DUF1499)